MNKVQLLELLQNLCAATHYPAPPTGVRIAYSIGVLHFTREAWDLFHEAVDALHRVDPEIYDGIAHRTAENKVTSLLNTFFKSRMQLTVTDLDRAIAELLAREREKWEVFRPLFGVASSSSEPIAFGPFHVYRREAHEGRIKAKYTWAANLWEPLPGEYQIAVDVEAREQARAVEKADVLFHRFEHVVHFVLGNRLKWQDIGIFSFRNPKHLKAAALSASSAGTSTHVEGALRPIDIADPYFVAEESGHAWIWRTLQAPESDSKCEWHARILRAIEWAGRGVAESDLDMALSQILFGYEALFKPTPEPFSPSITNSLAESVAFVVGDDRDTRVEIDRLVVALYRKRSDVVHARKDAAVEDEDVHQAFMLLKEAIRRLTTDARFQDITSPAEMRDWLRARRYE